MLCGLEFARRRERGLDRVEEMASDRASGSAGSNAMLVAWFVAAIELEDLTLFAFAALSFRD